MKDKPLVSILINNYNYDQFLEEAIGSALGQDYPHTEVVVVDDGSTDSSRQIIAGYNSQVVPVLKQNGGQASAFNAGFAASQGDIICLLDSDDIFVPDKVTKIVNAFGSDQEIGWCFHRLRLVNAYTGEFVRLSRRESPSRMYDFRSDIKKGHFSFIAPATSGLCFKRSILQQILPMPESKEIKIMADRYVKLVSLVLSKGFFLDEQLTLQKIHGSNAFTAMCGKENVQARDKITTAFHMRAKLPELASFTNKLFASGLGIYWRTGAETKDKELINKYLASVSPLEKLEINLRAFYHCRKL